MTEVEFRAGDRWIDASASSNKVRNDKGLIESLEDDGYYYYHDKSGQLIYRRKKKDKTAIFPTLSNPPTFGTVFLLLKIAEKYDTVIVLIYDKPGIMPTEDVVAKLGYVLDQLGNGKFITMSTDVDFANVTKFPTNEQGISLINDKDIVTTSKTIYANLVGKGYQNCILLEPQAGYNESFHRIAYTRSLMLARLRQTCILRSR